MTLIWYPLKLHYTAPLGYWKENMTVALGLFSPNRMSSMRDDERVYCLGYWNREIILLMAWLCRWLINHLEVVQSRLYFNFTCVAFVFLFSIKTTEHNTFAFHEVLYWKRFYNQHLTCSKYVQILIYIFLLNHINILYHIAILNITTKIINKKWKTKYFTLLQLMEEAWRSWKR